MRQLLSNRHGPPRLIYLRSNACRISGNLLFIIFAKTGTILSLTASEAKNQTILAVFSSSWLTIEQRSFKSLSCVSIMTVQSWMKGYLCRKETGVLKATESTISVKNCIRIDLLVRNFTRLQEYTYQQYLKELIQMNNFSKMSQFSFARTKTPKYCRKSEASTSKLRRSSSINPQDKVMRAKRAEKNVFSILGGILIKQLKQAFHKILAKPKNSQQTPKITFMADKRDTGGIQYLPNLLESVKNSRIQSYINFKVFESKFSARKIYLLANLGNKLSLRRKFHAFTVLTQHFQQNKAFANKQMILSQLKVQTQASEKYLNNFEEFQRNRNSQNLQISYVKIKLGKAKPNIAEKMDPLNPTTQKNKYISLRDIEKLGEKKKYVFSCLENKLTKKTYPTILK